ncbi:synaptonemal complex central element protein 1-like isoform X2 [Equus caballus]|uniref:synaptonemal complex central element protein 1-like isoform X2 n=1 Tax=Equus caballus TaxID=9796 RepID=UPI0038B31D4C
MLQGVPVQASRWKMAGKLEPLKVEPLEVAEESEETEGQTRSSKKTEDLLAMVKKLQKEGSLEPQIEDLINRINELQQVNGEKVHLEEVLSKKQEALRILQLHCQSKESEAQRKHTLQDCTDQISIHSSHMAESQKQRKPGLHVEEQLEDLMGQHKDLWEFHMLEQRLTWEIRALQSSKEQLLTEERLAQAKLEQVARLLRSPPGVQGTPAMHDGLAPSTPAPATRTTWRGRGAGPDAPSRPEGPPLLPRVPTFLQGLPRNKGDDRGPSSTSGAESVLQEWLGVGGRP